MWLMFYARRGKSSTALCAWYPTNLFYAFSTAPVRRNVLVHSCEFQINLSGMFSIDAHIRGTYKNIILNIWNFFFFCIISEERVILSFLHIEYFIHIHEFRRNISARKASAYDNKSKCGSAILCKNLRNCVKRARSCKCHDTRACDIALFSSRQLSAGWK